MTLERNQARWVLRLEGDCSMTSAAELKALLLEGLSSATELYIDLDGVEQMDVSVLQLLWAAQRASARSAEELFSRVPEALARLARYAGFDGFLSRSAGEQAVETVQMAKG